MKIRDLIDLLEQYAHDSDNGDDTLVTIDIHVREWAANIIPLNLSIDEVIISYAPDTTVEISTVLNPDDLKLLYKLDEKMKLSGY